jgi:hypothetical protein
MANCTSSLGTGLSIVDLKNEKEVYDNLYGLLMVDCDLTENEEYFQEDTLSLGFENEAERRVKEALIELGQPTTAKEFKDVADKVFESISDQEYFGGCDLMVAEVGDNKVALAYAYGGRFDS